MAVNHGRLEARIAFAAGWDLRAEDDGGQFTATIPAGNYYMSTFITEVETQLNASGTVTWTVSIADGEDGTGKVTISATGTTVSVLWNNAITNDNMWTLLGFADADSTGSTSYTGASSARMIWLPDGPPQMPFGANDTGIEEDDTRATVSPSGHVLALGGNTRTRLPMRWIGVSFERVRISAETVANQSWERFRRDAISGQGPGATRCGPIRLYWDADVASFDTFAPVGEQLEKFTAEPMDPNRTTSWIIPIDFYEVPT